jgi:hypothetical protein
LIVEKQIAECAGRIVQTLQALGGVNVLRLSEHLGERSLIAYQALGWLAREGRLRYERRGSQVFVALAGPNHGTTGDPEALR